MAKARQWAYAATLAAFPPGCYIRCGADLKLRLGFTFYPPTAARHDDDNLIASVKGYRDGIADALRMDDNLFSMMPAHIGEPVKGGRIVVTLT